MTTRINYKKELEEQSNKITHLEVALEKALAKIQSFEDIRKIQDTHITHLTERLGELKEDLLEVNSSQKEFDLRITKALVSIERSKPLELVKKTDHFEKLLVKLESKQDLFLRKHTKLEHSLDSFTQKLKLLQGSDELIKLQKKVKDDLRLADKISHTTQLHAAKLENHFIKINEKVSDATEFLKECRVLQKELLVLKEDVTLKLEDISKDPLLSKISEIESDLNEFIDITTDSFSTMNDKFLSSRDASVILSLIKGYNGVIRKDSATISLAIKSLEELAEKKDVSKDFKKEALAFLNIFEKRT